MTNTVVSSDKRYSRLHIIWLANWCIAIAYIRSQRIMEVLNLYLLWSAIWCSVVLANPLPHENQPIDCQGPIAKCPSESVMELEEVDSCSYPNPSGRNARSHTYCHVKADIKDTESYCLSMDHASMNFCCNESRNAW